MKKIVIILAVVFILVCVGIIFSMNAPKKSLQKQASVSETIEEVNYADSNITNVVVEDAGPRDTNTPKGMVEGEFTYPIKDTPVDISVCAEDTVTYDNICVERKAGSERSYQISLPQGNYYVYAKTASATKPAYYTEFVTCGLSSICTSHKKQVVTVKSKETTSHISPIDWSN